MSKSDQIRALRERQYAESQATQREPVTTGPLPHALTHAKPEFSSNAERQKRWRKRHPDLHRARHAVYMRTWRANRLTLTPHIDEETGQKIWRVADPVPMLLLESSHPAPVASLYGDSPAWASSGEPVIRLTDGRHIPNDTLPVKNGEGELVDALHATTHKALIRCNQLLDSGQMRLNDFYAVLHAVSALHRDIRRGQIKETRARAHRADWDMLTSNQRDLYATETSIARLRRLGFTVTRPPDGFVPDEMPMPIDKGDDE
jgi:hypothetical protein